MRLRTYKVAQDRRSEKLIRYGSAPGRNNYVTRKFPFTEKLWHPLEGPFLLIDHP